MKVVAALIAMMFLSGCASIESQDYRFGQARTVASKTFTGQVLEARSVKVQGRPGAAGAGIGGLLGGMAAGFGSGSGSIGAAGAVIGAILGAGAEVASTSQEGVEATILLDDGSLITVVQGSSEKFSPGDRVKLIAYKKRDGEVEVRFTRTTIPYQDPPQSKGLGS